MESTLFLIVLGILSVAILAHRMVAPASEGARGERAVDGILRQSLHSADYAVLCDVVLPTEHGTAHIDNVVVSRFGIFVITALHLDGEIFGSEWDSHWIHSLGDSRMEFPNPLRRNHQHVAALQELLGLRKTRLHSVVVFTGKAQFRNPMPVNVMRLERLVAFVHVRNTPILSLEEAARADQAIETMRLQPEAANDPGHSEPLPARPLPVAAAAPGRWVPRWPTFSGRLAFRALAGVASIGLTLVAGNVLIGGFGGMDSMGGSWPTANYRYPSHPPLAAMAKQTVETPVAPELAALQCSFSDDTRRCACFDAEGEKVPVELEQCLVLAGGDPR